MKRLKQEIEEAINNECQADITIEDCEGFFFFSDNNNPLLAVAPFNQVFVFHLTDLTIAEWVEEFRKISFKYDESKS